MNDNKEVKKPRTLEETVGKNIMGILASVLIFAGLTLFATAVNEYQARLNLGDETFRFAPGYGDVPLELQREIFDFLPEIAKIGIELDECNLMHPFKSMTGFIGFKSEE